MHDVRTAMTPEHIASYLRVNPIYPEFAIAHVACPHCGAAKGEPCNSSANPRMHWQRIDEAKAEMARMLASESHAA